MRKIALPVTMMLGLFIIATPAHAQATRTWVSGVGDDANPCSRTAPCKTFAGAISKTANNGEINCIDPGGFGTVTITKSITIDCDGTFGSILAALTNGVNINAAGITVNLRNISINGVLSGLIGVNFIQGNSLNLHNVSIGNFNGGSAMGVKFSPNSANSILQITDSAIVSSGNAPSTGGGVVVQPAAGGNAVVMIHNSKIENNSDGVKAASTNGAVQMTIRDSTVSNNRGNGISSEGASTINMMVDRATVSNNFVTGIRSGIAASTIRVNNSVISGNATGLNAVAGNLRSFGTNAVKGNGVDGTFNGADGPLQ